MTTLYIAEYVGLASEGTRTLPFPTLPSTDDQAVTIPGTSSAFASTTKVISVETDTACCILVGSNPTATTSNQRIPANAAPVFFAVEPGQKLSVVAAV